MELFGQKVDMSQDSIRSRVWKIELIALRLFIFGVINSVFLIMASFHTLFLVVSIVLSLVFGTIIWYMFKAKSEALNAEVNSLVSKQAYKANDVSTFEEDISEDADMRIVTRPITVIYFCLLIAFSLLLLFSFTLTWHFMFVGTLLPWIYLSIKIAKLAEKASKSDFKLSLNGALNKLYQTDTIKATAHSG